MSGSISSTGEEVFSCTHQLKVGHAVLTTTSPSLNKTCSVWTLSEDHQRTLRTKTPHTWHTYAAQTLYLLRCDASSPPCHSCLIKPRTSLVSYAQVTSWSGFLSRPCKVTLKSFVLHVLSRFSLIWGVFSLLVWLYAERFCRFITFKRILSKTKVTKCCMISDFLMSDSVYFCARFVV